MQKLERAIVCGGRDYKGWARLCRCLARFPLAQIATGGAKGADDLASRYAMWKRIPYIEYVPAWNKHGRAAGPVRNQDMLNSFRPDVVIAFPGGRGTADMVRRAKRADVPVCEVYCE